MKEISTVSLQNTFLTFAAEKLERNHRRTKSDSIYTPKNGQLHANKATLQEHMQNGRKSELSGDVSRQKLEVYAKIFEGWPEIWQRQKECSARELDNDNSTRPSTRSSTQSQLSVSASPCSSSQELLDSRVVEYAHRRVPRQTDLKKEYAGKGPITTVMVRNIPNAYTQKAVMRELCLFGLQYKYDFLYLPFDSLTGYNVGYVFINFPDPKDAAYCMEKFQDYCWSQFQKQKKKHAKACPAHIQGLENNMIHYADRAVREAKVMQHRPLILPSVSSHGAQHVTHTPERRPTATSRRNRPGRG